MDYLFYNSKFNGNLSNWDLKNVSSLSASFTHSEFNNNSISNWNLSNVETMTGMFEYAKFSGDISSWEFKKNCHLISLFKGNDNFKNKYNYGEDIPYHTKDFIKWFEENREKIKELNQGTKEEVLDFFSFENDLKKEF